MLDEDVPGTVTGGEAQALLLRILRFHLDEIVFQLMMPLLTISKHLLVDGAMRRCRPNFSRWADKLATIQLRHSANGEFEAPD